VRGIPSEPAQHPTGKHESQPAGKSNHPMPVDDGAGKSRLSQSGANQRPSAGEQPSAQRHSSDEKQQPSDGQGQEQKRESESQQPTDPPDSEPAPDAPPSDPSAPPSTEREQGRSDPVP